MEREQIATERQGGRMAFGHVQSRLRPRAPSAGAT